eukprot:s7025_g2.t1
MEPEHVVPDETEATSMALPENIDDLLEDEVPVRSSMRLLPEEADRMSSAIQDAGLSLGRTVLDVKLPWELPGLSLVFGGSLSDLPQSSRDVLPTAVPYPVKESLEEDASLVFGGSLSDLPQSSRDVLPTAVPYPVKESLEEDASSRDLGQRAKKARVSISLGACFRDVVNFNLVETDETLEEVKWTRALEMWMFVIMEDAECSAIGRKLRSKHGSDSLKCLRELFGKKASSTVAKRGSALQKFVLWLHQTNPGLRALPFAAQLLDDYIEQLQRLGSKPGAFTSFTEAVNFAVHVVGLPIACGDGQSGLFDGSRVNQLFSPWARGAVALEVQKKAERKQSAVLTTDAVQYLENFLANNDEDPVDRYAAGCLLFANFSRSRISDLRMVKSWFLDFDCLLSHGLGYLECCTRSHKTARDVAASGLAMPLIAPALGLGKVSWAVGFVQVAFEAYNIVYGMLQQDTLVYQHPNKFTTRQHELQLKKAVKEVALDGSGCLTVRDKPQQATCDTNGELELVQALRRRALAFDLVGACSYETMNMYHSLLVQRIQDVPPPNYARVSVVQALRADRAAFTRVAEKVRSLKVGADGARPLDHAFEHILEDTHVSFHLLPIPEKPKQPQPPLKRSHDNQPHEDKGGRPPKKGKGSGKGKKGGTRLRVPKELIGKWSQNKDGERLCWAFNMQCGCKDAAPWGSCSRGLHLCAEPGCLQPHSLQEHGKRGAS